MKQAFSAYCGRYLDTKRVALCIALTLGSLLFITDYCRGQASDQPVEYETPGVLDAYEILPPDLLEGKDFWLDRRVVSYGLNNRYKINSHFGRFEANGEEMLRIREHEIAAIGGLREIKKTKAFGEAFKKAATSPLKGAAALITDPVDTVKGIPKGIGKFFGIIVEMKSSFVELEPIALVGDDLAPKQAHDHVERLLHHGSLHRRLESEHAGVGLQGARADSEHAAPPSHVIELHHALGHHVGVVIGK